MVTEGTIYWITRLTVLSDLIALVGFFMIGGTVPWFIISDDIFDFRIDDRFKFSPKKAIVSVGVGIILMISSLFIPTSKEMLAIKIIPKIANSQTMENFDENTAAVLQFLGETLRKSEKE